MNDIGTLEKTIRDKAIERLKKDAGETHRQVRHLIANLFKIDTIPLEFNSAQPKVWEVTLKLCEVTPDMERCAGDEAVRAFLKSRAQLEVDVMELKQRIEELEGVGAA